jgi:hypothetical protein
MSNAPTNEASLVTAVTRLLTAGRQVEAQGDPVVFTCAHAPLTEAQRHFLACGEALVRACEEAFAAMLAKGEVPTGACWVCGAVATDQCDYRYDDSCYLWIC